MLKTIWKPQPKQALALRCPATELFFGGAAGGGKSDFLLADFLQGAALYGNKWNGILCRKTFKQLEELQKRAAELFVPIGGKYIGTKSKEGSDMWVFPNGANLKMRYLESEKDVQNYQGHQYTWIGFDELGNYPTPYVWVYMMSRLRSASGVPTYIRGTANPGGVGHGWIKARFMDNAEPNRIQRIEVTLASGRKAYQTRCFIPSRLEDNMILMRNDPQYEINLLSMPEHLRRALRYGDWSVFAGQVFSEFSYDTHVVKPFQLPPGDWFKFTALDWGYTKPYSLGWYAVNSEGRVVKYREWYGCRDGEFNVGVKKGVTELAREAWDVSITEGVDTMVADPAIWAKQDNVLSFAEKFREAGWNMVKGNNDRINGLIMFHDFLVTKTLDAGGNEVPMFTCFPNCKALIRTLPLLTPDPNHMEDIDTRLEDHAYDETRYALMSEFVKAPGKALQKQNGVRERETRGEEYNPLDNI